MTGFPPEASGLTIDLYCRLSKDDDGTLINVDAQEVMGRRAVEGAGHRVGRVFKDNDLSGWNPKVNRPDFNECMDRMESGANDGVWVRDLDRFTRKMEEALRIKRAVEKGAVLMAGHSTYDLSTSRGLRNFYDDAVDAEVEAKRISERTSRGKAAKAARGKSNASWRGFARDGLAPKPEGWEPGDPRTNVDPALLAREREAVREAVTRLLNGGTMHSIAEDWNAAELYTVTGKRWDGGLVRQLLCSPSLCGRVTHKGEVVAQLDGEHALDGETFDRLQTFFAGRKRGRPASTYLLSGLLTCGQCGGTLYGRPRTAATPYEDGEVRREYWCQPRIKEGGCGRLTIDQRFADDAVTETLLQTLGDPRHADRLAKVAAKVQEARSALVAEQAKLEETGQGIASKAASRGLAWVDAAMEPIDKRLAEIRAQLANLEDVPDVTATVDAARAWGSADLSEKRAMVRRAFPDGITIQPASSRGPKARTRDRFDFGRRGGGIYRGHNRDVA